MPDGAGPGSREPRPLGKGGASTATPPGEGGALTHMLPSCHNLPSLLPLPKRSRGTKGGGGPPPLGNNKQPPMGAEEMERRGMRLADSHALRGKGRSLGAQTTPP
ncbi:hypothetical protein KIL84_007175 [Mauremys mutica]|uniref:Uncharacterized protein n=1 Tax=Mauremys mutica TaxID=74926 RepID=A0A9D3X2J9_9SAUR|nr:hypothetical protein KIL84_007175 [Mauremys mutica]